MGSAPAAAVTVAWLFSALAFAVAMAGTPGPNNAMLTSSGSLWGFRRTVPHMLGISIGFPAMLLAVALGAGGLLRAHPTVLTVMRWLGAGYLLYLAWKIATTRPAPDAAESLGERAPAERETTGAHRSARGVCEASAASHPARAERRPLGFLQAAMFQWINPKAWLVTLSALATVASTAGHPSLPRALILAGVFLMVTWPITAFWTAVGVGVSRFLATERAVHRFNLVMAALLVDSLGSVLVGVT